MEPRGRGGLSAFQWEELSKKLLGGHAFHHQRGGSLVADALRYRYQHVRRTRPRTSDRLHALVYLDNIHT